jgi:hypothetical protein
VEYPSVIPLPDSGDTLVLTDYITAVPGVGNLARVRQDGQEVWRTAPDPLSQGTWTVVWLEGQDCVASTWSGWEVRLDLVTGAERSRVFTK